MIKRILIRNYKCFDTFEIKFDTRVSMLIGENGVGKSSVSEVLSLFRDIGNGNGIVPDFEHKFSRLDSVKGEDGLIRLEIDIEDERDDRVYSYSIAFDKPARFSKYRVRSECLRVGDETLLSRELGKVTLTHRSRPSSDFVVDWHFIAIPVVREDDGDDMLSRFKDLLSRIVVIKPIPELMTAESKNPTMDLKKNCSNIVDCFMGALNEYPSLYGEMSKHLEFAQKGFRDIVNEQTGLESRHMRVRYSDENGRELPPLPFSELSDGEKCQVVASLMIAVNHARRDTGGIFCFWDEPDNYIMTKELKWTISTLCARFSDVGQFIATSHSVEAIMAFASDEIWRLHRISRLEATNPPQRINELNLTLPLQLALVEGLEE